MLLYDHTIYSTYYFVQFKMQRYCTTLEFELLYKYLLVTVTVTVTVTALQ